MYINNEDLEFLIKLENKLGTEGNWSEDVLTLWNIIERCLQQREKNAQHSRENVAKRRKDNPDYGRSKKELEAKAKAKAKREAKKEANKIG